MAIVLITHDLGVVARMADDVAVMYAGQIVEQGAVDDIFYRSRPPLYAGLEAAMPRSDPGAPAAAAADRRQPADLFAPPPGCAYAARCPHAMRICAPAPRSRTGIRARCRSLRALLAAPSGAAGDAGARERSQHR